MRQCSCLNTVLSGPADTMGVPGEHCGQCKCIQCWLRLWYFIGVAMLILSKQQVHRNYFHFTESVFLHYSLQNTMWRQIEHLHARWTIPDRGGFRSYPCHCQCHLEMFEYGFVSTSKSARFLLCRSILLVCRRSPDPYLISGKSTAFKLSDFCWTQTFVKFRLSLNSDFCRFQTFVDFRLSTFMLIMLVCLMCSWAHGDSRLEGWRGKPEV